jgi:hypothetical protein
MEDTIEPDKSANDNTHNEAQYVDCIRLVEGGHIRRFESAVEIFDVVEYESNDNDDEATKPLIFYAIEHDDETFVKVLLEMEVPLNKSYSVSRKISFYSILENDTYELRIPIHYRINNLSRLLNYDD